MVLENTWYFPMIFDAIKLILRLEGIHCKIPGVAWSLAGLEYGNKDIYLEFWLS